MNNFFRNIRESLINNSSPNSEGKTLGPAAPTFRYLKYALGEIVLVVIGILLALQINNWNEERKDRIKENKVLASLLEDFRYSQSKIKKALDQYPNEIKRLEASLAYIGKDSHELNQNMRDTIRNKLYISVEIAEGSIQSVLSTEKLELILNDSLKSLLTAYPSESGKFKSQTMNVKEIVINLHRPILESYVSLTERIAEDVNRFPLLKKVLFLLILLVC